MSIEAKRAMGLECPLGPDVLWISRLVGQESLSANFELEVWCFSERHDIKPDDLLGQHATVRLKCGEQPTRYVDGIVCEVSHVGGDADFAHYRLVLRPWLWLLSRNRDFRIFQRQNTLEIVRSIFERRGFSAFEIRLTQDTTQREYCVQYGESDLAFVMRLLEDDGVYFFFEHDQGQHKLILADNVSAHDTAPLFETLHYKKLPDPEAVAASILAWKTHASIRSGKVVLDDHDFEKPNADISAKEAKSRPHEHSDFEVYEFPGNYRELDQGTVRARRRMEEANAAHATAVAHTDASGITPGVLFTLASHPREHLENGEYLVTSVRYEADAGQHVSGAARPVRFNAVVRCMRSEIPYRPARKTPRPVATGAETATVVGADGSEIWTDEYGRIKVQFHWDREGRRDESSSCWLRVAQTWAGDSWGSLFIPRVGQEVVVSFLHGDPDRPLVTGSVYNAGKRPPYSLPDKQNCSGIKTQSTKDGGESDYNELQFDDSKGQEKLSLRAQRDMSVVVNNDRTTSVGNDETRTIQNDLTVKVVEGAYVIKVEKANMGVFVMHDTHTLEAKNVFSKAAETIKLETAGCTITMDQTTVELTSANGAITLGPQGVEIKGLMVKINSEA